MNSVQNFLTFADATTVIAVCAILSPILTAVINGIFRCIMRRMKYAHEDAQEESLHRRAVFDEYVQSATACILSPTQKSLENFGLHSGLICRYVPADIRSDIIRLERAVLELDVAENIALLSDIIAKLDAISSTTCKEQQFLWNTPHR